MSQADGNKVISIKFNIPQDLVSVAVGRGGENYKRARAIDGITQVFVDQDGTVRLSGTSDESLLAAREILEVDVGVMEINVEDIGLLIGSGGESIKDITARSGVIFIKVNNLVTCLRVGSFSSSQLFKHPSFVANPNPAGGRQERIAHHGQQDCGGARPTARR